MKRLFNVQEIGGVRAEGGIVVIQYGVWVVTGGWTVEVPTQMPPAALDMPG